VLDPRPNASQALVEGYLTAAQLAERRRALAEEEGDASEGRAWRKIAAYCWMMVKRGGADLDDSHRNLIPVDDQLLDWLLLHSVAGCVEEGNRRRWTRYHQMALNAGMALLSNRETEVALMHYAGFMPREYIAYELGVSKVTVDCHLRNIQQKWRKIRL
jgi:DNA-binding CsgD family transcriptional regulator